MRITLRRAAIIVAVAVLVVAGTALAAGIYGSYKGYNIVKVKVDGREVTSDVPAVNLDGRTMVPLRFVSEALGATVTWDQATYTASIASKAGGQGLREGFHVSDAGIGMLPATVAIRKDILSQVPGQGKVFLEVGLVIKNFSQWEVWISPDTFPVMIGDEKYSFHALTTSYAARLIPKNLKANDTAFGIIVYEVPEVGPYYIATGHMLYSTQVMKVLLTPMN